MGAKNRCTAARFELLSRSSFDQPSIAPSNNRSTLATAVECAGAPEDLPTALLLSILSRLLRETTACRPVCPLVSGLPWKALAARRASANVVARRMAGGCAAAGAVPSLSGPGPRLNCRLACCWPARAASAASTSCRICASLLPLGSIPRPRATRPAGSALDLQFAGRAAVACACPCAPGAAPPQVWRRRPSPSRARHPHSVRQRCRVPSLYLPCPQCSHAGAGARTLGGGVKKPARGGLLLAGRPNWCGERESNPLGGSWAVRKRCHVHNWSSFGLEIHTSTPQHHHSAPNAYHRSGDRIFHNSSYVTDHCEHIRGGDHFQSKRDCNVHIYLHRDFQARYSKRDSCVTKEFRR